MNLTKPDPNKIDQTNAYSAQTRTPELRKRRGRKGLLGKPPVGKRYIVGEERATEPSAGPARYFFPQATM